MYINETLRRGSPPQISRASLCCLLQSSFLSTIISKSAKMVAKSATLSMAMLGMASAHTIMQAVGVNGKDYAQGHGIYMPSDDSFQSDVTSDSMACNGPPVTYFQSSTEVIPVKAGDTVTGSWLHTLTSTGPDSNADNKVIDSSHKGPVLAYMKKVSDATKNPSAGPGDGWFKIAEAGLISSTQWGVDALIDAGGVQTVTIPSCIEDGDYLLRFEVIALHDGTKPNGAQFYVSDSPVLLIYHASANTWFTDGVRSDRSFWRHWCEHPGDCLDSGCLLRKSALFLSFSLRFSALTPKLGLRPRHLLQRLQQQRPTLPPDRLHHPRLVNTHAQFCRWHTSQVLTSPSRSRGLHLRRWFFSAAGRTLYWRLVRLWIWIRWNHLRQRYCLCCFIIGARRYFCC